LISRRLVQFHFGLAILWVCALCGASQAEVPPTTHSRPRGSELWTHENLVAWCVVPFDAKKRTPEERASMLERLGFKHFAYDWRDQDVRSFDAEIEALQRHGIDLLAWWYPLNADDAQALSILETFKRHHVHPQLWVMQSLRGYPQTLKEWDKLLPNGLHMPRDEQEEKELSPKDRAQIEQVVQRLERQINAAPTSPQEQHDRVKKEADRIEALVKLADPYGSKVQLYNHNRWFGRVENEIAIIKELHERGWARL
jgi:hypothetical protein